MAQTPEQKVRTEIKKILEAFGAYHFAPVTGGYSVGGLADENVVYKGVPIAVEAKPTAKEMPTLLQTRNAVRFNKAGGIALLIHKDNLPLLRVTLEQIDAKGTDVARFISWPPAALKALEDEGGA